jgi:hypothetical protein
MEDEDEDEITTQQPKMLDDILSFLEQCENMIMPCPFRYWFFKFDGLIFFGPARRKYQYISIVGIKEIIMTSNILVN